MELSYLPSQLRCLMYKYPWKFQELARINGFLFKNKNKNKMSL
jgi:hypothetical protein